MIQLQNITQRYGQRVALSDITLSIAERQICGLWGRNGAGKTTLLRITAGLLKPDSGTALVLGKDPAADWKIRREIGISEEGEAYFPELTIDEFLWWVCKLRGCDRAAAAEQMKYFAQALSLDDRLDQTIASLSHGMRRKTGLAAAFLGRPHLLILDEPTNGLDVDSIQSLCRILAEHRDRGGAALIATHDALFLRATCSKVFELERGVLTRSGDVEGSDLLKRVLAHLQAGLPPAD